MLKKAGIVLAATAAGLLSVSPLAFAGDYNSDDDYKDKDCGSCGGHSHEHKKYKEYHRDGDRTVQSGLVNLNNTGVQVPAQACGNSVNILSGAFGILGSAKNETKNNVDCKQSNSND
ncbi:hypothetical protein [Pseudonocardia acaciae]|uniref:hypothetical protein n=1 Tax=Pseudonocardia acaciae TaxID=551276 RepID=UPI000490FEE0|nr:hypothetical protein [Pseudonocardia acaciae]